MIAKPIRPDYARLEEIREQRKVILGLIGSKDCPELLLKKTFANCLRKVKLLYECHIGAVICHNNSGNVELFAHKFFLDKASVDFYTIPKHWKRLGNSAAHVANSELVDICDMLMCYWDFRSKEVKAAVQTFRTANKPVISFGIPQKINPLALEVDEEVY